MKKDSQLFKSIRLALIIIVVFIVYAYGFTVTKVDFKETREEKRMASFTRIIRALAHPKLVEYDYEETDVDVPFYLPCQEGQTPEVIKSDTGGAYITVSASCGDAKSTLLIQGFNFQANSAGPINFMGKSAEAPDGVPLQMGNFKADAKGTFSEEVTLPNRQSVDEAQTIRATGRIRSGPPRVSKELKVTWNKIVETVFMALLATTFGTMIAIPISFFAAKNIMSDVKSPMSTIALSLIGWPIGLWLGGKAAGYITAWITPLLSNTLVVVILLVVCPAIAYFLARWVLTNDKTKPSIIERVIKIVLLTIIAILVILTLIFLADIFSLIGESLIGPLGSFWFLGNFVLQWGDILAMFITGLTALTLGSVISSLLGRVGMTISDKLAPAMGKTLNLIITPLAFAAIAVIILQGVDWFYEFNNLATTVWWPAGVGAVFGLILAIRFSPKEALPVGMVIYTIIRTILNATRSIEALVMAIVFVTWAGLGPFAGALALGLHTVAALSKLYSEQVESIQTGPLEAITATGATRLQTIVFAVVPQIVPPYISFTMYRWDINVRMSTIIGFVGGGGIGFVLQQNINLLNYRAASVNMVAIAVVVASMDYISSTLRERFV